MENNQVAIFNALNALLLPDQVFEVRILGYDDGRGYRKALGGFFNDRKKAAKIAAEYESKSKGVYFTLNPVNSDLLARCFNRVDTRKDEGDGKTADKDVLSRTILPLDCDPVRSAGISATEEELRSALGRRDDVLRWLVSEHDFPEPILGMSGNGGHALWDIALPNDDDTRDLLQKFYQALHQKFSDGAVDIDRGIYNAARIWKLYGTLARKGEDFPTRPHRRSEITSFPDERHLVAWEQIEAVAALYHPEPESPKVPPRGGSGRGFDVERWMADHGLRVVQKKKKDKMIYVLAVCPFNEGHTDHGAAVTQEDNGKLGFVCHHSSCADNDWDKLREKMEPGRKDRASLPVIEQKETRETANEVMAKEVAGFLDPDATHCTDLGNARRLVRMYGKDILYVHAWKKWLIWAGSHWQIDEDGAINRLAREVAGSILREAAATDNQNVRKALIQWALASESRERLIAMVLLAQDEQGIGISHERLDSQHMLLAVENGALDLRTGALAQSQREDYATKALDVAYDPNAECPTWERFILEIMDGDAEMARYLQKCIGYTLTGATTEQCMFFLFGAGKNGKSILVEVLRELLQPFWKKIPAESLMAKRDGDSGVPNDIARLPGARMVVSQETEEGRRWNEAKVKDLSGGDTMPARFMRAEWFDFQPTHKLWMYGNHKPQIKGTDDGIWRRLRVIPFNRQFLGPDDRGYDPANLKQSRPDPDLKAKLIAELPGILAWAVRGCLAWRAEGLESPEKVKAANRDYREEMDLIGLCLQERFVSAPNAHVSLARAFTIYENWCEQAGLPYENKPTFSKRLKERGLVVKPGTGNVTTVYGLGDPITWFGETLNVLPVQRGEVADIADIADIAPAPEVDVESQAAREVGCAITMAPIVDPSYRVALPARRNMSHESLIRAQKNELAATATRGTEN